MKFANIDKLRGFAATSVLVCHVIEHCSWSSFPTKGLNSWWRMGWIGVDLFFVLSGFVIYFSAYCLHEKYGAHWRKVYAMHRLARIAPLYFLTLFVFAFLVLPEISFGYARELFFQVVTHFTFTHNLFPSSHGAINGVNWSIGVEMQFYLLVFLLFPWLERVSALRLLLVFCGIACFWRMGVFLATQNDPILIRWIMSVQLPGCLDEFAFGIITCKLVLEKERRAKSTFPSPKNLWRTRFVRIASFPVVRALLALVFIALMLKVFRGIGIAWANHWSHLWYAVLFGIPKGLSAALLIFAVIAFPERWLFRLSLPLDYLGKISYGIYLWHLPVILSMKRIYHSADATFLTMTIITTIILSAFSYHILEQPWMEKAKQYG